MGWQALVETLARERGPALVGYAYLLTGDLATAQDVVQDAFVRTSVRFRSGSDPEHLEAYVRQAILNAVRDGYRRRRTFLGARVQLSGPVDDGHLDGAVVDHVDVQRAMAALSPRERACVVLRHFEDLPVREVAESLRLSEGAVKRYLSDARARLGELLADPPGETWPVELADERRPAVRRTR
jgi:RNA polymerase sigma-70 factor (ECF subfamily)